EAWDRFKDLLRACPHHGFSKLHQLDTFYNALNSKDQDSLNFAAGGNFLDKMPHECLAIIERKSKVRYSHNKPVVAKVSMNTSTSSISPDVAELKDMVSLTRKVKIKLLLPKAECLALADLSASINLMPLFVWDKLSLPDLSPTCMTLKLADRSISHSVGVAEDRSFLKIGRALIDVFEGELTLRVGKEAITFNIDQTSRYSANYNEITAKRIDVIDMACKEYSQELLGFSDVIARGNPTPYYDLIVSTTSLTLTPFRNSDFLLEEVDAFLALIDDPTLPEVDQSYLDPEGDILLLEAFLNDDPSLPPPNQGNYMLEFRKELKTYEAKSDKSSIDEPQKLNSKIYLPTLNTNF
nr:hypothetical protein [Tanacetum cinerariifolium]GFA70464.1 hypothetical protein [Tanacetum cinerariifolium]